MILPADAALKTLKHVPEVKLSTRVAVPVVRASTEQVGGSDLDGTQPVRAVAVVGAPDGDADGAEEGVARRAPVGVFAVFASCHGVSCCSLLSHLSFCSICG